MIEILVLAALSAGIGVLGNRFRRDPLPPHLPSEYFHISSGAKPLLLGGAKRLFEDGNSIFVDARGPEEFARGQINGALNVPFDRWRELYPDLAGWIDGRRVVVYSSLEGIGQADGLAGALLARGRSRDSLYLYLGGIAEWREAGLPTREGVDRVLAPVGEDEGLGWEEE